MARPYRLISSKIFAKDVGKLPPGMQPKVAGVLRGLKKDPHSSKNVKKLTSVKTGAFRLRIGDFRLRYDVIGDEIRLHVIRHRKDVYKN